MNFKFKRLYHRVFSIFLVIVLSVLSVPTSAVAKEGNEEPLNISTSAPISDSTIATDLSQEVIWPVVSDEEAMRREQLIQNGYSPDDYSASEYKQMAARGELQPLAVYPVVLADGVYAIKNIGNSSGSTGFYLDTALAHWLPGYNMQQHKFTNGGSPLDNFSTSALFKITRNTEKGSYVIRIMRNNALSFGIHVNTDGSNEILSKEIPLDDSAVALTDTYVITASGSGYYIRKYGTTNLIATRDTDASGTAGAPDSYLYASSAIGDQTRWTFTQYTGVERNSAVMLYSSIPTVGQSTTLIPVIYSTRPGYNMPYLDMSQMPSSSYHISGPNEYGRFTVTPHDGPTWNIDIYVKKGSAASAHMVFANEQTLEVCMPIDEGIYFFENAQFPGKYMQIDDDSSSSTNGAIMELWDFDADDDQRWNLDHISDGYYKITSVASGKALTMPTEEGASVTQTPYEEDFDKLWYITENSNGTYSLQAYVFYLAAGDGIFTSDGRNVEGRYEQSDAKDEWNLTRLLPTSGYELNFNDELWNDEVEYFCNCYAYAINNQVTYSGTLWYKQQPGELAGEVLSTSDFTTSGQEIFEAVQNDFIKYNNDNATNCMFVPIGKYDVCPAGTYKIALVVNPGEDYHWYRQDSDGLWSHKPGVTEIRRTDNSNKLIVDPQSCDRGDYTAFVGYYAVTPWNNYYTSSRLAKNLVQTNQTAIIAVEALEQIQVGMTYDQVTRILGVHGRDIGSGAIIFEYNLITGETVNIYFHRDNVNDDTLYVYAIDY